MFYPQKAQETQKPEGVFCAFVPSLANLFLAGCGSVGVITMTARVALADTSGFAAQPAQVIELGSPDATSFHEVDVVDDRRVQREDSFNADAKTRFSDSDGFASAAMFTRDYDALKSLQSLFGLGLLNPHVHADRIAWLKLWNILTQLRIFNFVQSIHYSMLLKSALFFQQVRTLTLCFNDCCFLAPTLDLRVIPAQQYFRHFHSSELRRPGVLRVVQQTL